MKKFMTLIAVSLVFGLSACAGTETDADYSYESQAPYGNDERTQGTQPDQAEEVFVQRQRK